MERAGDFQLHGLADAEVLRHAHGDGNFARLAGDDDLAGGVDVGHIHVGLRREVADDIFVHADHRGHSALGRLAGFLHELSALRDDLEPGGEVERARGGVRGEFAEREPGGGGHREIAELFLNGCQRGEPVNVKGGLADGRFG